MLTHSLERRASGHSPVLVLADPLDTERHDACRGLLATGPEMQALVFAYSRRPQFVADQLGDVEAATVLSLGEADSPATAAAHEAVTVESLPAANLTRVGVAVADALDRHDANSLSVCLGSVTTLLQYVDVETAFKFLHVTLGRLDGVAGTVHGHLDPAAVDEETVATMRSLFESVLVREGDGWAVEST